MARVPSFDAVDIDVSVDGRQADQMMAAIDQTLAGPNLFNYLQDHMAPWMRKRAAARFRSEGDDASGPWAPLSEATVAIREEQGYGGAHPINKREGGLEDFMTRGRIDYTIQANGASMLYPGRATGDLAGKLDMAQRGAGRRVPARPVAAVSFVDLNYFIANFTFWFAKETQQRFRGSGPGGGAGDAGAT